MVYAFILGTVVFTVVGQLLIKFRLNQLGHLPDGASGKLEYLQQALLDPLIILGFVSAFLAALCWILAMARWEISYVYPFIVAGLAVLTFIGGVVLFNDSVTPSKLIGAGLIVAGVLTMGVSR